MIQTSKSWHYQGTMLTFFLDHFLNVSIFLVNPGPKAINLAPLYPMHFVLYIKVQQSVQAALGA
jgi:hypothetical protein